MDRIDKEDKYNVDTLPYGVYYITNDKSINGPSGEKWMVYVTIEGHNLKPIVQIAFPIGSTKMYFRTYSSMWCPWRAVSAT